MTSVGQEAANDYGSSLPKGGIALTQSAPLVCLSRLPVRGDFHQDFAVVGAMEWVCLALSLFYSSLNGLRP